MHHMLTSPGVQYAYVCLSLSVTKWETFFFGCVSDVHNRHFTETWKQSEVFLIFPFSFRPVLSQPFSFSSLYPSIISSILLFEYLWPFQLRLLKCGRGLQLLQGGKDRDGDGGEGW